MRVLLLISIACLTSLLPVQAFNGTVYLPPGEFTKIAEDGNPVIIKWRTALGALQAAALQGGFDYSIKTYSYGVFVRCIAGICAGSEGPTSGWMYQVNGKIPMVTASNYIVNTGDTVIWYFARNMTETPETSPKVIKIYVQNANLSLNVVRKLPISVEPNETFNVTLQATGGAIGMQINEYLPVGFKLINWSYEGADSVKFSNGTNNLTFIVTDITADGFKITYTVKAPNTSGTFVFLGTCQALGGNIEVIGGDYQLTVGVKEIVSDNVPDDLEQIVSKYYPKFDWRKETPTKGIIVKAVIKAVQKYFVTTDKTLKLQIVNDVTKLVVLYFSISIK